MTGGTTYSSLLELLAGVAGEPEDQAAAAHLLTRLRRDDLEAVTMALVAMVSDELPLTELRSKAHQGELLRELWLRNGAKLCDPARWGDSAGSRAAHGTRSRYNAGCRGEACTLAERRYSGERSRQRTAKARAEREARQADQDEEVRQLRARVQRAG